jgi:hypothetical protein
MGYIVFLALLPVVLFGAYQLARRIDSQPGRKSVWTWVLFFGGLVVVIMVIQDIGWLPVSEPAEVEN